MPIDLITLSAAFLSGLLGSVHCVAMCGGIATSFGLGNGPRSALPLALRVNAGRVLGYALAGLAVGAFGAGLLQLLRIEGLRSGARLLVGAVLVLVAFRLFDRHGRLNFLNRPGIALWRVLAPIHRRLLPANTPLRQWAAGVLWGWLPCGLSTTMLVAAWLEGAALHGALLMASFGLGTLPLMLPLTWSGARAARWLARPSARAGAGALLLCAGVLTMSAPWLAQVPALHQALEALGCRSLG